MSRVGGGGGDWSRLLAPPTTGEPVPGLKWLWGDLEQFPASSLKDSDW